MRRDDLWDSVKSILSILATFLFYYDFSLYAVFLSTCPAYIELIYKWQRRRLKLSPVTILKVTALLSSTLIRFVKK
jgi:hypothetical protein